MFFFFFFSSRRRHTRFDCDWSSDVCSSDLHFLQTTLQQLELNPCDRLDILRVERVEDHGLVDAVEEFGSEMVLEFPPDRKSTRLNSSHSQISYAVFCLKKKNTDQNSSSFSW